MNKNWMRGVAHRNKPTLESMMLCAKVFEMQLTELITVHERKYDE